MARPPSAASVLRNMKKEDNRTKDQSPDLVFGEGQRGLTLPNYSGDHSAGSVNTTPTQDEDLVNKKYVDDSAGGGPHDILSVTHTDSAPSAVTQGSIIVGDATPEWSELPIGASTEVLKSDGTDAFWEQVKLDEVDNPSGDTTFNFAANLHLHFRWTGDWTGDDGAFEIEAIGAFTGDLLHVHQHTGNPGVSDLGHFECVDNDVTCLRAFHAGTGTAFAVGDHAAETFEIDDGGNIITAQAGHDVFSDYVADEHLDWTSDLSGVPKIIHANNYVDNDTTYVSSDFTHDDLISGTIADHDTTATGANLTTLTDTSNADALHDHTEASVSVTHASTTGQGVDDHHAQIHDHSTHTNIGTDDHHAETHTIVSHDTDTTGAELTSLADNSMVDTLHRHSELSASDGTPDAIVVVDAAGLVGIGASVTPRVTLEVKGVSEQLRLTRNLSDNQYLGLGGGGNLANFVSANETGGQGQQFAWIQRFGAGPTDVEVMRLDESGHLGIGEPDPTTARLVVSNDNDNATGDLIAAVGSTGTEVFNITNAGATTITGSLSATTTITATGNLTGAVIQPTTNYKSVDGSNGLSATGNPAVLTSITVKNGLVTAWS